MTDMKILPKWYGGKPNPAERAKEQRLLSRFREQLEELKLKGAPPEAFKPVKGPYASIYDMEVELIRDRVRQGDVVLDIGAGQGRLVDGVLDQAGKVIALEPDLRAIQRLSEKYKTPKVEVVRGVAEDMSMIPDGSIDLVAFIGNSMGMMWKVVGDWEEMVCTQKEAILEMVRVARREVSFIVYGKETIESSLTAYLSVQDNVVGIKDGLMLVEMKQNKPFIIMEEGKSVDRFVYQKFDRAYLENLLADAGITKYSITGVPKGTEYGFLVTIEV